MFVRKYGAKVLRIDLGVVAIPLFWVDVPSSSKCVRLLPKFTGAEADDHIELVKVFRPANLPAGQDLRRSEVLQVLMIGDDVDGFPRSFQVVSPGFKSFEDCQ